MSRPLDTLFEELSGPSTPLGPTDWPDPASLRRKAEHRRTVRRASLASTLAVVAAVAVAVPATLATRHEAPATPGGTTTAPTAGPTTAPTATPPAAATLGAPLTAGEPTPTGTRTGFGTFSLVVPTGWSAKPSTGNYDAPQNVYHRVCIAPPVTPTTRMLYGCAGLDVYYGDFLPGSGTRPFSDAQFSRTKSAGWHHGTAAATCPAAAGVAGFGVVGQLAAPDPAFATPQVGNAKANYNIWTVPCTDGSTFHPQSWFLPKSRAVAFLYDEDPAAEAVLATIITTWDLEHPSS